MLNVLQFLMHADLIHVNTTVDVPTLPTGFNADVMKYIQETRALVCIIIIPVISGSCTSDTFFIK